MTLCTKPKTEVRICPAPSKHEFTTIMITIPRSGTYLRPVNLDGTMCRGSSFADQQYISFEPSNMSLLHVI